MNKTTHSKPGALRRIVSLFFLVAATVAVVCAIAPSSAVNSNSARVPNQAAALAKIAPWVLDRTGTGQKAEYFIVLADQADLAGAAALPTKQEKGRFVRDALWNKAQSTQGPLLTALAQKGVESRSYYIVNMILVKGDFNLAVEMASRADVARVEGNPVIRNIKNPLPVEKVVSKLETPTAVEPGVNYTKAPLVWALGYTGQGVVVGGADTGYRWTHNALKNKYRGWDGVVANHDFNWHDSVHSGGGSCGADSTQPCDDNGHGTHTMGTSVGDDGVTNQVGMAPGARWIGCRNMDQGNGSPSTYMECFEFFLAPYPVGGTPAQGNPALAPDVTTNSWSCPSSEGCSAGTLQAGVEAQRAAGIEMVVAAQNSGPSCSTVLDPPGIYEAAYTVGALTTNTDTIASFSSRGPITADGSNRTKPEISAPGTGTRSSYRTSDTAYANLSGTSMATPHIAGAMALLISAKPTLRHNTTLLQTYLNNSAEHISSTQCGVAGPPNNVYGYGRVNIKRAVSPIASAVSRKTHMLAGTFDVNLPLTGEPGIECRNSGGNHTLVITFDGTPGTNDNVTGGTATVTTGTGVAGAPTFSGTTMTVPLTGVSDAQKITVTLQNVSGATWGPLPDVSVSVNMLVGDTNASKSVNSSDISQTKGQLGQTVTAANFRQDVNVDGGISSSDVALVKAHNGVGVP